MSIRSALFALGIFSSLVLSNSAQGEAVVSTASASRTIELKVTDEGFRPTPVKVKRGEPLTLVITRTSDQTCAKEIVIKDYGIRTKLPLNKAVSVSFTPDRSGELTYSCGMNQMVSGTLFVE
jgi:plastocyanin domain-containing protein